MTPLTRERQYPNRATVTRNPLAGQTGIQAVAEDVMCSEIVPMNHRYWNVNFGTDFTGHEVYLETDAAIQDEDVVTISGKSFTIKQTRDWPPLFKGMNHRTVLLLERRKK
jgi:hypothetical protein